ncbi:OmpP1/FadL family transporter [Alkalimarinus alittae]|uniref:Outer membrane protein transport protein n=1 Tax=Alkalimarinus alittae TaxID=2961619 RepID=A0ABY6N2R9_9ALTE|nr:outer membrane protein transport protein [Alkalimarinus alittae]UZE96340.1 outer membrane protein transport protein [Alkalimarinus alittae]
MSQRVRSISALASALSLAALPTLSLASGYALNEQSASASGMANAGSAANPENATIQYFNPAGLTHLDKAQVTGGVAFINVDTSFKGSATNTIGQPVNGSMGGDFVGTAVVPNLYMSTPINDKWAAGIGIFAPFGTSGNYNDDFVGRFFADETELKALAVQPTIAYKVNDQWSVGLGIDFIHAEGTLTKFQDYSALSVTNSIPLSMIKEGHFDVSGDDNAVGWNFGVMYQPTADTTIGFNYKSKVDIELNGDASITNVPAKTGNPTAPIAYVTLKEKALVPLTLPESVTLSLKQQINTDWAFYAGATWTRWSQFENLDILSGQGTGPVSALAGPKYGQAGMIGHVPEQWENVWAFSVGTSYAYSNAVTLKAGYAYDESPIQKEFRTARVPATDRNWFTVGAQYKMEGDWVLDGALGYLFIDDVKIDEHDYRVDGSQIGYSNAKGTYELSAYALALQLTKRF